MKRLTISVAFVTLAAVLGVWWGKSEDVSSHSKKLGAPTDSPVVVRGGSLNFLANTGNSPRWYPQGALYVVNNVPLNNLYLDGVTPSGSPSKDPVPQNAPITPANYWAITLAFRGGSGDVTICTQTKPDGQGGQVCNTKPSGALASNTSGPIYVQGDPSNTAGLAVKDKDRLNVGARLHYAISTCQLGSASGASFTDRDPDCDKIKSISIQDGSSTTTKYVCVDGACDIGIGQPPS